jgi:hypothetical protein
MLLACDAVEQIGKTRIEIDLDQYRPGELRDCQRLSDDLLVLVAKQQHQLAIDAAPAGEDRRSKQEGSFRLYRRPCGGGWIPMLSVTAGQDI